MDRKTVYIETSIISYLVARPSRDLLAAAWQKVTIDWWDTQRDRFDLYTSDLVIEEAGRGDDSAVSRRLAALAWIPSLEITPVLHKFLVFYFLLITQLFATHPENAADLFARLHWRSS
jgi:hypothetical protein